MTSTADDLRRLRASEGIKWSRYGDDVIPAWVADMDLVTAPAITERLEQIVAAKDFSYNFGPSNRLGEAFARWQKQYHGWDLDPELVRPFCDVLHAVEATIWLNSEPGDGIVLLTPIYPPFIKAVETSGRHIVDCPLDPDGWVFDPEVLKSVIDERTKLVLLCNPHNPTGRVFSHSELEGLAEVAKERDLLVISDEVWCDLTHPGTLHRPFAPYAPEHTVTVCSASKSFNLASLRCAVAYLGSERARSSVAELSPHVLGAVSTIGAEATLAAWAEGQDWLQETKDHLSAQRDHLAARLAAELPLVKWQIPEATYLAWLDFRPLGLGDAPSKLLLEEALVALSSGLDFGHRGAGFARMNLATTRPILDEIVDRIVRAVG